MLWDLGVGSREMCLEGSGLPQGPSLPWRAVMGGFILLKLQQLCFNQGAHGVEISTRRTFEFCFYPTWLFYPVISPGSKPALISGGFEA